MSLWCNKLQSENMPQAFFLDASRAFSGCMRPTATKLLQAWNRESPLELKHSMEMQWMLVHVLILKVYDYSDYLTLLKVSIMGFSGEKPLLIACPIQSHFNGL